MKAIEIIGKTVDEAINKAIEQLNVTKDMIDVEVLEVGSKGLFNLFGVKPAKVKVLVKDSYKDKAEQFLKSILANMNISAEIHISEDKDSLNINISGDDMGTIIGYRGETLDAIQYLLSLVVNKNHDVSYKRVVLDTENYRKKREETLKRVADKTAYKVIKSRRAYKLEPMNPYERRIIHAALQGNNQICTYSEGEDPFRRIVVDIKRNK